MYYIGLDVHKKTISYCVKDASGQAHQEGKVGATRCELDAWIRTLPRPWTVAMEATIFTGWIYDHLLPHAAQVKVAHPVMLRANRGLQGEERPDRCQQDCGLLAVRFPARVPYGFHGDSGPAPHLALSSPAGTPNG